jgi:hypothetical protein
MTKTIITHKSEKQADIRGMPGRFLPGGKIFFAALLPGVY